MIFTQEETWCRSFISIIFPKIEREKKYELYSKCRSFISIIFPYIVSGILADKTKCRSFISIIFPNMKKILLSVATMIVSILYKYHISLTKYSTFWTLISKNVVKWVNLAYFFRPPHFFWVFFVLFYLQNRSMVEKCRL